MSNEPDNPGGPVNGRRSFLMSAAKSLGLAGIGGVLWGGHIASSKASPPPIDKAVTIEYTRNDRTGKHAVMAPLVHSDACTGCGMCEHACVTTKASIFVLPRELAMGASDIRYVKGWDTGDEQRMKDMPADTTTKTRRSEKTPLDYLNEQDLKTGE